MSKGNIYSRFAPFAVVFILFMFLPINGNTYGQKPGKKEILNSGSKMIIRSCYASNEVNRIYIPPPEGFLNRKGGSKNSSNIQVDYFDFPKDAKSAFQYAMDIWSTLIASPVKIYVSATWTNLGTGTLGSTYLDPSFVVRGSLIGALEPDALYPYPIAEKMYGEEVNNPEQYEIEIRMNSSQDWYYGTDGETPPDKYDFVGVVLHEMGHGLGFYSTMTEYQDLGYYGYTSGLTYYFDHFIVNGSGQQLIDTDLFENGSAELLAQYVSNNLFYASPIAQSENGGMSPKLYAPGEFNPGSSISHLDENTFFSGTQNALMTPFIARGEAVHHPGPITMGILAEIGWVHTYIEHDTLPDAENLNDPFTVATSVTSDTVIQPDGLYLYYSVDDFTSYDSLPLIETAVPGDYTADIPVVDTGFYVSYFIQVEDHFNREYRSPATVPDNYYRFFVGKDLVSPTIEHDPIFFMLSSYDSVEIDVEVFDNLGIDSVYVEYFINEDPMETVRLSFLTGNRYKGAIEFADGAVVPGDSIRYRVVAVDRSTGANMAMNPDSGYYHFPVAGIKTAADVYENDFSTGADDFLMQGFSFETPVGFDDPALHSIHPYAESGQNDKSLEYLAILVQPIIIDETNPLMKFDEIVLVEPGEEGAVYGDDDFWDYVIVEASKDSGRSWVPLLPGYDSGINTIWKATYNSNINDGYSQAQGASNMFRQKTIDLLQETSFSNGDEIIIRFRLFSDAFSYGWGWVIENLRIQADFSGIENDLFVDNNLLVYPNPASGNIFIEGQLTPGISQVWLSMNDLLGRNIHHREVVVDNGILKETIDLSVVHPGIYIVKITSGNKISTFKIIVTE